MKNKILLILISFVYLVKLGSQNDIALNITNKSLTGNSWTFDLEMTIVNAQGGNWGTMNIRNNIEVPGGVLINHAACSFVFTPGGQVLNGTITSFTGGAVTGTDKLSLNIERNTSAPNLTVGSTVTLATYTIIFTNTVPGSNLITPRPFAATGSGATFWIDKDDALATRRPFNIYPAQPLPIKLRSFSAVKDGERATRLDWVSSSELNSDYFGIERSQDGSNWENIGQVLAAGNSDADIDYQYVDRKLPNFRSGNNIFYYRLRMTDLDGKFQYSDVRGVNFGKATESFLTIYPNPTTEIINIDLSGINMEDGEVMLSVYDANGRNMINKNVIGNGIELIEMNQYPAGTYNVVVIQGDNIQQKKIIKID